MKWWIIWKKYCDRKPVIELKRFKNLIFLATHYLIRFFKSISKKDSCLAQALRISISISRTILTKLSKLFVVENLILYSRLLQEILILPLPPSLRFIKNPMFECSLSGKDKNALSLLSLYIISKIMVFPYWVLFIKK